MGSCLISVCRGSDGHRFPQLGPTVGQTYTFGGLIYVFTAQGVWTLVWSSFCSAEFRRSSQVIHEHRHHQQLIDNDTSIATTAYVQSSLPKGNLGM